MIPIHHKRTRVSYSVRSEHSERTHSSGVNALALDVFGAGSLYSGGRDAAVHGWSLQMDFAVLREEAENHLLFSSQSQDLNIIQNQAPSQSQNNAFSPHPAALQMSPQRKFSAHSDHIAIPPRASTTSAAAPVPTSTTEMLSEYARLSHPAPQPSHPASNHRILNTPQKHSPSLPRSSSLASPSAMLLQRNQNTIGDSALDASHSPQSPHPPLAHAHAAALQKKSRSVSFVGNGTVDASADVSLHGPIVNEYTPSMRSITPHHHNPRWVPTNALSSSPPTTHSMAHPYQQRRALLPTVHARSFQAHSDWVNDIVLCNRNQSIVTASNDRMVYLWSTTQTNMYMRLGYHNDHVKCLAYSSGGGWVASGGLDRRVMIWDTQEGREREIVGFAVSSSVFCHDKSPQASIYALACNPAGTTVVSGSPDKVVRVWDPRSGKQAIGLTGHRDNVRGLLVSDDGKWVLSASSDTTIKLWSLSQPQRCMVTYTHYEDSVWCLYSNHPDLDTFWAGGRDGLVTKMSRRRMGGGDVKSRVEDELVDCVAVCKETGPVHKLVAVDDMFVWTATNSSSINRWRDIPFRQATVVPSREMIPDDPDGAVYIPKASIIQQHRGGAGILGGRRASGAGAGASGGGGGGGGGGAASFKGTELSRSASLISRDTYSLNQRPGGGSLVSGVAAGVAASANSTTAPRAGGGGEEGEEDEDSLEDVVVEPVWTQPDHVIVGGHGIQRCSLMNNRIHAVTEDTVGRCAMWDIVKCVKVKDFAEDVKFQDACDSVNTFEWIANWCTLDTKNGYLTVHLEESKFHEAEIYFESLGLGVSPQNEDVRVNIGKWVLTYLFICYKHVCHQQVPAAAVMYHDHYLGALTYTHLGAPPDSTTHYLFGQSVYYGPPDLQFDTKISQQPLLQQHSQPSQPIKPQSQMQPNSSKETASTDGQTPGGDAGYVRAPRKESLGAASAVKLDAGPVSESGNEEKGVLNSLPAQDVGACAANGGEGEKELGDDTPLVAVRLRPKPLTNVAARPESLIQVDGGLNYVAQIVKRPIPYAPNPDELPPIRIPPDVSLLVSCEEAPEAACYLDQFRSTVGQIGWVREAMRLDECIPRWVAETLMDKKLKDLPKMSFMMMPHPYSNLQELPNNANRLSSSRMIRLRKLLAYVADNANIQPPMHLVKVAYQAQNQPPNQQPPSQSVDEAGGKRLQGSWSGVVNPGSVEAIPGVSASPGNDTASVKSGGGGSLFGSRRKRAATSGAASTATTTNDSKDDGFVLPSDVNVRELVKPEEYLELCCQDKPLEPKMTLGTVKNLIWKSGGGDLTLTYRRKNV